MAYVQTHDHKTWSLETLRTGLRNLKDTMVKRRVYRTTLTELQTLSARELADLGIARSEIRRIAWAAAEDRDIRS